MGFFHSAARAASDRARGCDHGGLTMAEPVEGGHAARCLLCGTVGPVRDTPEAARKALLALGKRDGG